MATKHTCNNGKNPVFGRKTPGCARCDELIAGAPSVKWSSAIRADQEASRIHAIRNHNCVTSRCGPVCTAFEW